MSAIKIYSNDSLGIVTFVDFWRIVNYNCITHYFRGRKFVRKMNLKYFCENTFSRIYCSRENIFPRKYLPAKITSRENIFSRKYLPAKISSCATVGPSSFCITHWSNLSYSLRYGTFLSIILWYSSTKSTVEV